MSSRVDDALLRRLRTRLAGDSATPTSARLGALVREEGGLLGDDAALAVVDRLRAEMAGAGPLEGLLADPAVTDILVNGPSDVWVDRGHGLERAAVRFADEAEVRRLAERLAGRVGRRLDEASPWVDGRLPRGVRLHAVVPPAAVGGTLLSLRVMAREPFSLDSLAAAGAIAPEAAALLRRLIASRASFVVSGGTGSGKTTLLAALLGLVPVDERMVVVEDTCELAPEHPHVVRLEGRPANVEGAGAVSVRDLVRQALRMRPDRLVVGEVRGAEVIELLGALNTGHEGGCGTLHARSSATVPARFEALATAAGLGREAVHSQLLAGVDVVVHMERDGTGQRHVAAIGVLERVDRQAPWCVVTDAWSVVGGHGPAAGALDRTLARAENPR